MEYDEIPEEIEDDEVVIYEDIDGNIEIDDYLTTDDVEDFKAFLLTKYKKVYYAKHPESFEKNKPFRYDKPFTVGSQAREVDWMNKEVLKLMVLERAGDLEKLTKEIVRVSGKVPLENSKATVQTPKLQYMKYKISFQKWLDENDKGKEWAEPNNRERLADEWAEGYIAEQKLNKQKRIKNGTKVLIYGENVYGTVIDYDAEDGKYTVLDEQGATSRYTRKEIEVVNDANGRQ
jgi:hypothetical protein